MSEYKFDNSEYNHILKVLDKRSKNISRYVLFSVCFALVISSIVAVIGYNIYRNPSSPLSNIISSTIDAGQKQQALKELRSLFISAKEASTFNQEGKKESASTIKDKVNAMPESEVDKELMTNWVRPVFSYKSTSEKIAESISSVIVTFGILMFIGFALRATLVFIKYYMQLGTDFDNQRIAFMLSKGDENLFSKNLSTLRNHKVNFDKTPSMPQEKVIDKLIELSKIVRNDSGKT